MKRFGFDISEYEKFFKDLPVKKPDMVVFGTRVTFDEAIVRIRELSEPQNPINPNKLVPKKALSTSHLFKNGSRKVLKRVHQSNVVAFNRAFGMQPPPPAWFVNNSTNLQPLVDMLLAVNVSPLPPPPPPSSAPTPSPKRRKSPVNPLFNELPYIKLNYSTYN